MFKRADFLSVKTQGSDRKIFAWNKFLILVKYSESEKYLGIKVTIYNKVTLKILKRSNFVLSEMQGFSLKNILGVEIHEGKLILKLDRSKLQLEKTAINSSELLISSSRFFTNAIRSLTQPSASPI